jgi:hypothetical protein
VLSRAANFGAFEPKESPVEIVVGHHLLDGYALAWLFAALAVWLREEACP